MKKNPLIIIALGISALVVVAVLVLVVDRQAASDPLPIERFQESPDNFINNRYQLVGRVERVLGSREGVGRLYLISAEERNQRVPLFLEESLSSNIEAGARYRFQVQVRRTQGMTFLQIQSFHKL